MKNSFFKFITYILLEEKKTKEIKIVNLKEDI